MTEQQPTRFENYPPEPGSTPFGIADPTPAELLPPAWTPPPVLPQRSHSRRGLIAGIIALAIGGPIALGIGLNASGNSDAQDGGTDTWTADPADEPIDEPTDFTAGDYGGPIPSGWELEDGADGSVAVLRRGANQVTVLSWSPSAERLWPVDDIVEAVQRAGTGFKGTLGEPVNESTGTRALATLSGRGTFLGERAREFAELWLDDSDSYLLIVTVLTAAEGSPTARQATDIAWNLTSGLR